MTFKITQGSKEEEKAFKEIINEEGTKIVTIAWNENHNKIGFSFGKQTIDYLEFFYVLQNIESSLFKNDLAYQKEMLENGN
jgi:hypothetical protein